MAIVLQTGALATLEQSTRDLVAREAKTVKFAAGQQVFAAGRACQNYLIVTSGSIRVSVTTEAGREIVLYRVAPGETCVLTVSGLMSGAEYEADGVAEAETEAVVLPKPVFDELLAGSPKFRAYVFSSYGGRLHGLIGLVQEIAIKHIDRRLARLLTSRAEAGNLAMTHQAIAAELNTAREVVTRLLNDFAERGWVNLGRGRVTILDGAALDSFSGEL